MTILLVLSFINAICFIFASLGLYTTIPTMVEIVQNGQIEEFLAPYSTVLNNTQMENMRESLNFMIRIDTKYWLFLAILYIGSLVGVVRMFKGDKIGFHIYSISQILILINSSVYLYHVQPQSGFFSDLMLTAIFILLYYLYFKRMEMSQPTQSPE